MKAFIVLLILGSFLSCTKQLITPPDKSVSDEETEKTKLDIINKLGEIKNSKNVYYVVIIDHQKKSKIEYPIPKDKKWAIPVDLGSTECETLGEEVGAKDFFLMELSCKGASEYDIASVVACGPNDKFDAETLRVLKKGNPYLTIQIHCTLK